MEKMSAVELANIIGAILIWFTSVSHIIAWILIIIGGIILLFGFLLKTEAS